MARTIAQLAVAIGLATGGALAGMPLIWWAIAAENPRLDGP
jgi:hypothetical protein